MTTLIGLGVISLILAWITVGIWHRVFGTPADRFFKSVFKIPGLRLASCSYFEHSGGGVALDTAQNRVVIFQSKDRFDAFSFNDILAAELVRDGQTMVTTDRGSQVMGAAVGAALLGPVGLLAGAVTGSKRHSTLVSSVGVKILTTDLVRPVRTLVFYAGRPLPADSARVTSALAAAEGWWGRLRVIIERQRQAGITQALPVAPAAATPLPPIPSNDPGAPPVQAVLPQHEPESPSPAPLPVAATATPLYAGFWRRLVALILDTLVLVLLLAAVGWGLNALVGFQMFERDGAGRLPSVGSDSSTLDPRWTPEGIVLAGTLWWIYHALLESSQWGATLGKRALGLRVTTLDGKRLTFGRATARHFGKVVSALLFFSGYLLAAVTPRKQALHDRMAECIVMA